MSINSEYTYNEYFNLGLPYTVSTEFNGYGEPLSELKDPNNTYTVYGTPKSMNEVGIKVPKEKPEVPTPNVIFEVPAAKDASEADIVVELPPVEEPTELVKGEELLEVKEMDTPTVEFADMNIVETPEVTEVEPVTETVVEELPVAKPVVKETIEVKKPRAKRVNNTKNVNKTKVNK